jgi:hypothetical protein
MKNNTGITNKIKHFIKIFDKRSYKTFKIIINWILCLKNWKQWDLANLWEVSLWKIQYFFDKSNWDYEILNKLRVQWIRNKIWWARDKISDTPRVLPSGRILIFDATVFAKNKASKFSWLADYFFYPQGAPRQIETEKLLNEINSSWRKFMSKTIKKTKSWLVVLDSGFKWAEMCKNIYENALWNKYFLMKNEKNLKYLNY